MVYLHMDATHFGLAAAEFVRAPYGTKDEAMAQAVHNIVTDKQRPIRIVDEEGAVLHSFED